MDAFRALSRGTKLVLVAGTLLFFSLFFTWQNLEVDFGPAGKAVQPLDGWDAWGLLLALVVLGGMTLVVLLYLTDVDMSEDVPWESVSLGLGAATLAITLLKNVTDADSSWASYSFVLLAAAVAAGTYLNWEEANPGKTLLPRRRRPGRGLSRTA